MLPVGVPYHVVARVFRRMMRLRRYMLRSAHVRELAVERLLACRRACEFRTGNNIPWGKCVFVYVIPLLVYSSLFVGGWEARPSTEDVNGGLVQADTRTTSLPPPRRDDADYAT